MRNENNRWLFLETLTRWVHALVHRDPLQGPVHVGAFAGSYLERRDWDHA